MAYRRFGRCRAPNAHHSLSLPSVSSLPHYFHVSWNLLQLQKRQPRAHVHAASSSFYRRRECICLHLLASQSFRCYKHPHNFDKDLISTSLLEQQHRRAIARAKPKKINGRGLRMDLLLKMGGTDLLSTL